MLQSSPRAKAPDFPCPVKTLGLQTSALGPEAQSAATVKVTRLQIAAAPGPKSHLGKRPSPLGPKGEFPMPPLSLPVSMGLRVVRYHRTRAHLLLPDSPLSRGSAVDY